MPRYTGTSQKDLDDFDDALSGYDYEVLQMYAIAAAPLPHDEMAHVVRRVLSVDSIVEKCTIPHVMASTIASRLSSLGLVDISEPHSKGVPPRKRLGGITAKGISVLRHLETLEREEEAA